MTPTLPRLISRYTEFSTDRTGQSGARYQYSRISEHMQEDSTHVHVAVRVTVTAPTGSVTVAVVILIVIVSTCFSFVVVVGMLSSSSGVIMTMSVFVAMSMIMGRRCGLVSLSNPLGNANSVLVRLGSCVMGKRVDPAGRDGVWAQRPSAVLIPRTKGGSAEADRSVSILSTVAVFVRGLNDSRTGLSWMAVQGSE